MPKTVNNPRPADGESLYNTEEKLFDDIKANPGERRSSSSRPCPTRVVALVNLLTVDPPGAQGFRRNIVLYGPGVLLASGTRGYPAVGRRPSPATWPSTTRSRPSSRRAPRSTPAGSRWVSVRLPETTSSRGQGVQPARRARLGAHRLAGGRLPDQHLDRLRGAASSHCRAAPAPGPAPSSTMRAVTDGWRARVFET